MPVTIHLVRHAQGFHNLNWENQQIPDPYLTPLGHEQCAQLRAAFPHHDRLTHLVASPLRRTLVTCYESFQPAALRGNKKVIAQPLLQETSSHPCDTGSAPEVIRAEYGAWADCGLVEEGWNDKTSPGSKWAPRVDALEERAREARVWLRELARKSGGEDDEIVVVTHGGFLHFLTQDWDGMDLSRGTCTPAIIMGVQQTLTIRFNTQGRVGLTPSTDRTSSSSQKERIRRPASARRMRVGGGDAAAPSR